MNKLYYCSNCINNKETIVLTELQKWGSGKLELPIKKEAVVNGFIDYPSSITDHSKCPHCGGEVVELSLTTDEWNVLKEISTESDFILQMNKLKQSDVIDFNLKLSQFKANTTATRPVPSTSTQPTNVPKCPTCGSTNVKKIGAGKRWVSTGMFGLASSNLGKTMQCGSCGAKW